MRFKFDERASYLYDQLQFPTLLFVDRKNEKETIQFEAFEKMTENVKKQLNKNKETLSAYYSPDNFSAYQMPSLLMTIHSIKGYASLDDYLEYFLSKDNTTLKHLLVASILSNEDETVESKLENYQAEAVTILKTEEHLINFVKKVPTEENFRWQLFTLLHNPKEKLKNYYHLLKEIEPVFDAYYNQFKSSILTLGDDLIKTLNEGQIDAFETLTHHMIPTVFLHDELNRLLISFVQPFQLSIRLVEPDQYFIWGFKMEEGFKALIAHREEVVKKRTDIFKILGDKTRYEVLKLIAHGESSTKKIAEKVGVSSATISYHINAFVSSEIIKLGPSKQKLYVVNEALLNTVWEGFMQDLSKEGEPHDS